MKRGNVFCPLYDKEIYEGDCFEITVTAEGMGPIDLKERLLAENENFIDICLNCPNHRE